MRVVLLVRLSFFTKAGLLRVGVQTPECKGTSVRVQLWPVPREELSWCPAHASRVLPQAVLWWLQVIVTLHHTPTGPSDTDML